MRPDGLSYPPVDFLTIGHVCHDVAPDGYAVGGAAAYTAAVARALGCRAGIVTSAAPSADWREELDGLAIHRVDAEATTIFENVETPNGRVQTIHAVAGPLGQADIPAPWRRAPMVFIGPIANEIDPRLITMFSNSIVGVGPQGWMRRWDEAGRVYQVEWDAAAEVLPLAAVAFLSTEDITDPAVVDSYAALAGILVVTEGANGCTVYCRGEVRHFPAPAVTVADATGAGDIFAASYLIRLHQTDGNYWAAAEFANRVASRSVTRRGLPDKMRAIRRMLEEELRHHTR